MKHLYVLLLTLLLISGPQRTWAGAVKCQDIFPEVIEAGMPGLTLPFGMPKGYEVTEFAENTTPRVFVELAGRNMLLNQQAPELDAKGLLKPNGGLCASTCVTNVLGAMTAQEGNFRAFPKNAPEIVELVIDAYGQQTNGDARMSANVNWLARAANTVFPQILQRFQYDSMFENPVLTTLNIKAQATTLYLANALKNDAIAVATVRHTSADLRKMSYHAIVVLKVDRVQKKIYYSDPNLANLIIVAPYTYSTLKGIRFNVPMTYGNEAVQLIEADIFTRTLHKTY